MDNLYIHDTNKIGRYADGSFGAGDGMEYLNHQDSYLKTVFGMIGITDVNFIHVNNTAKGEEAVREAIAGAHVAIEQAIAA
ncbi:MAG: NAD(P)H-dependent oxidoreductase [Pyrinomonadaceae bacterium]|nr:NAD(P)H-dependent oxidoreductase [Pyrinomonadaceae bacterium]